MKTKFLTIAGLLFINLTNAFSVNFNEIKVKDFNFASEINYDENVEEIWNEQLQLKTYVFTMKNSSDFLIACEDKSSNLLTPIAFYQNNIDGFTYKDINNRKEVLNVTVIDGKVVNLNYIEANDSKSGFALKGCPGGSTINCIRRVMQIIASDGESAFYCALSGAYCPAAVAASCAISCNS